MPDFQRGPEMVMTNLAEHLASAYDAPEDDTEREAFRIDSPNAANWALRKLAQARAKFTDAERQAFAEITRINDWLDGEQQRIGRDAAFFEGLLTSWHQEVHPDEKTVRLSAGTLLAWKSPDSWVSVDAPAFITWAEANHPELVWIKKEPNIAEAKRVLSKPPYENYVVDHRTGEVVPGIEIRPGEVYYSVATEPILKLTEAAR